MRIITRAIVLLIGTVLVAGSAGTPATASVAQDVPSAGVTPTASSDVLLVAPGKIGALKMGASKKSAKRRGWIRYSRDCGWGAGPKALRFDADGNEVFKAYPDKVTKRKVRSMHAFGNVVTKKGIRAASLDPDGPAGSPLADLESAYPRLRHLGVWRDYVTDRDWPVYSTGSRKRGWLDFYLDPDNLTVNFVQVRAHKVKWGRPMFGC